MAPKQILNPDEEIYSPRGYQEFLVKKSAVTFYRVAGKPVVIEGFEAFDFFLYKTEPTGFRINEKSTGLSIHSSMFQTMSQSAFIDKTRSVLMTMTNNSPSRLKDILDRSPQMFPVVPEPTTIIKGITPIKDAIQAAEQKNDPEAVLLLKRAKVIVDIVGEQYGNRCELHNILNSVKYGPLGTMGLLENLNVEGDHGHLIFDDEVSRIRTDYLNFKDRPLYGEDNLPGGINYKEIVLRLPDNSFFDPSKASFERHRASTTQGSVEVFYNGKPIEKYDDSGPIETNYMQTDEQVMAIIERLFYKGDKINGIQPMSGNRHSYAWYESNVTGYVTFTERVSVDGDHILFVEDIGRDPGAPEEGNWEMLALKEAAKFAAEKGIDKIAIIPFKEWAQARDWNHTIQSLTYWIIPPSVSGRKEVIYGFTGYTASDGIAVKENYLPENILKNFLGEKIAKRIVNNECPTEKAGPTQYGSLVNLNLELCQPIKSFLDINSGSPDSISGLAKTLYQQEGWGNPGNEIVEIQTDENSTQTLSCHAFQVTEEMRVRYSKDSDEEDLEFLFSPGM